MKFDALVAVPDGVVTVILPVVAPLGTLALPSFATLKLADVPLNRTLVAPVKWLPLMVTDVPTAPLDGEEFVDRRHGTAGDREVRPARRVLHTVVAHLAGGRARWNRRHHLGVRDEVERGRRPVELHAVDAGEVGAVDGDGRAGCAAGRREAADRRDWTQPPKSVRLTPTPSDVVTRILPVVAPIGTVAVRCWSSDTLNVVATLLNETTTHLPPRP